MYSLILKVQFMLLCFYKEATFVLVSLAIQNNVKQMNNYHLLIWETK